MTLPPFDVQRTSIDKLVKGEWPATIFVFVGGPAITRKIIGRRLGKTGIHLVTYRGALAEATAYKKKTGTEYDGEWTTGRAAWSILRAQIGIAIREGNTIVVDAPISPYDRKAFTAFGFSTGARAVIALDPESVYEEELEQDGFTGAFWIQD